MTRCIECGSTTTPIWESDDEWVFMTVCMECVKKKRWGSIKVLSLVNILDGILLLFIYGFTQTIFSLIIIVGVLVMELVILCVFCPFPLYGENRRRYKEWKRKEEEKE